MRIIYLPLVFLLLFAFSYAHAGERAECFGPVAKRAAKFPCVAASVQAFEPELAQGSEKEAAVQKSPGKAFILSLLVPGLGELYAGAPSRAKVFLATEAAVWSGFAALELYSSWKKNDYESYAVAHAGVNLDGKDDDYFKDVDLYEDIWSYNEDQLHARDFDDVYWDETYYFWEWDSEASRTTFNQLRTSSRRAHRRAINLIGAAVLNRLISAVDALRTARISNEQNDEKDSGLSLDFKIRGSVRNPKALVVLEKTF